MVASLLKANLSHIVGQQAFLIKTSNTMSDNFLLCSAIKIITVYDFQSFSTLKVVYSIRIAGFDYFRHKFSEIFVIIFGDQCRHNFQPGLSI